MPIQYNNQFLCELTREEFFIFFADLGIGHGKSKEIYQAMYALELIDLQDIFKKNKKLDVAKLSLNFLAHSQHMSKDGSTKLLITTAQTQSFEAVKMPIKNENSERITLCVSSQVGCALDCSFCVTGTLGLKRNLKTWEIVEQVLLANSLNAEEHVSNVVFMGMGEPFYNYENVKKATQILSDDMGLKIAPKRITVSTAGVVPKILAWAKEGKTNLAVSLIAADDDKRSKLMSINQKYPLSELMQSIDYYTQKTGKKVLCEYILIKDETDTDLDIKNLVLLLKNRACKLNVIPYNESKTFQFKRPSYEKIMNFAESLRSNGIVSTVRWSHAGDVNAACGQLSAQEKNVD